MSLMQCTACFQHVSVRVNAQVTHCLNANCPMNAVRANATLQTVLYHWDAKRKADHEAQVDRELHRFLRDDGSDDSEIVRTCLRVEKEAGSHGPCVKHEPWSARRSADSLMQKRMGAEADPIEPGSQRFSSLVRMPQAMKKRPACGR